VNIIKQDIAARKAALVGSNRYLLRQYAPQPAAGSSPAATAPTPQTHIFDPQAWKAANPIGNVNAAIQQAKTQGFQIKQ
jgi:hypothetical protein